MSARLLLISVAFLVFASVVSACGSRSSSTSGDTSGQIDTTTTSDLTGNPDTNGTPDLVGQPDSSPSDSSSEDTSLQPDTTSEDTSVTPDLGTPDGSIEPDVTAGSKKVVFIAMGDFGTGGTNQKKVAAGIKTYCDANRCDFVLGLGDLIYDVGVTSVDDPQFQTKFETPYKDLTLRFYQSPGNHDYYSGPASINAMIAYTQKSTKWYMPAAYYNFTQAHVDFFSLDTHQSDNSSYYATEISWFRDALSKSTGYWRVGFGHYPLRSNGAHGDTTGRRGQFLRESLCGNIDVYFAGHDHDLEYLNDYCGVILIVSGGGGAGTRELPTAGNQIVGFAYQLGFTVATFEDDKFWFTLHDENGTQLYKSPVRTKLVPNCTADGICDGRCSNDPDCGSQDCTAGNTCNSRCTMDTDCRQKCPCDFNKDICEPVEENSTVRCGCDPDCLNQDAAPCTKDGHCDTWCPTGTDPDC